MIDVESLKNENLVRQNKQKFIARSFSETGLVQKKRKDETN